MTHKNAADVISVTLLSAVHLDSQKYPNIRASPEDVSTTDQHLLSCLTFNKPGNHGS